VISASSNKFQKTRFWKEKSVEDMVTLGPTAQATLVIIIIGFSLRSKAPAKTALYRNQSNLISLERGGVPVPEMKAATNVL